MTIVKRLAVTVAEAAALSILISFNLRWIAKARRLARKALPLRARIRAVLAAVTASTGR